MLFPLLKIFEAQLHGAALLKALAANASVLSAVLFVKGAFHIRPCPTQFFVACHCSFSLSVVLTVLLHPWRITRPLHAANNRVIPYLFHLSPAFPTCLISFRPNLSFFFPSFHPDLTFFFPHLFALF
jgi:hypothetical protein